MKQTNILEVLDFSLMWESLDFILAGLGTTLSIALISFCVSLIAGTVIALVRFLKIPLLSQIAAIYVSFFRGVPALVVLFFLYFGLPFAGITMDAYIVSIIGFSLTSSAYSSEIIRSSIIAIDIAQWEMALDLGATVLTAFRRVILPQAGQNAIPALSNVILDLIKGTSLTAMITVNDIFQRAKIVGGSRHNYMSMYLLLAIIYWVICFIFEQGQKYLERKFDINPTTQTFQSFS